jgi:TetR/AcrR family transcriptional regulator of autoinduction and epiphytic fitness
VSRATPPDPRRTRSRAAILAAAQDVLVRDGVTAVTVEAVVQRSGVARSTVYRHFPTSTAVVVAALQDLAPQPTAPGPDVPVREALTAVLADLLADLGHARWSAAFPSLLEAASRDEEMREVRDAFTRRQTAPLREVLLRSVAAGELRAADVERTVALLAGPLLYARLLEIGDLAPDLPAWLVARALPPPGQEAAPVR